MCRCNSTSSCARENFTMTNITRPAYTRRRARLSVGRVCTGNSSEETRAVNASRGRVYYRIRTSSHIIMFFRIKIYILPVFVVPHPPQRKNNTAATVIIFTRATTAPCRRRQRCFVFLAVPGCAFAPSFFNPQPVHAIASRARV